MVCPVDMCKFISTIAQRFLNKPRVRILMIGLDNSGKTTILFKLKLGQFVTTQSTIGFNVETIDFKDICFSIWDVGGQSKIRPLWRHYSQNIQGVIFVVDSTDRERVSEARNELHRILSDENELDDASLLVFANKNDLENTMTVAEVAHGLGLYSLGQRPWYIQATSAIYGHGLYEGLDWLSCNISKKTAQFV